ncbi:MAG TPA: SET domain-containing protein [Patescibacteria group bacterium]
MNKELPHSEVYTRLQSSPIHGVGVFAIRDIAEGINIFSNDESGMTWIDGSEIKNIDPELKRLYDDFCVIKDGKYGCPQNFNMLTVGWYLNESEDNPNVRCTNDYDFVAMRYIKKGEELLIDYSTYSEYPKNSLYGLATKQLDKKHERRFNK